MVCGMTDSRRVDEEDDTVHHRQDALDLAAEIGVTRRVHDIDVGILPVNAGAFGEDGDAALALEIVGIHRAFLHVLVFAHGAPIA